MMKKVFQVSILTVLLLMPACERRIETKSVPFPDRTHDYVLTFVFDMSTSFQHKLHKDDAAAFAFFTRTVDAFFRERVGFNDKVVIAQLSDHEDILLWQGEPRDIGRAFPNKDSFWQTLVLNSRPHGSRVYKAVGETLNYVRRMNGVKPGHTQLTTLILSDLKSSGESEQDKEQMLSSLRSYFSAGGALGLYWVWPKELQEWRKYCLESGAPSFVVEPIIDDRPSLPNFSQ